MNQLNISPPITRVFPKGGKRFLCQFRERDKDYFITDCAFDDFDHALSYTGLVVRFVDQVAAGKVLDAKTKQEVFTCQRLVALPEPILHGIREAHTGYNQLVMWAMDEAKGNKKSLTRQQRKVEETLSRLRQLHEELNAQLYSNPTERPIIHSPNDAYDILRAFMESLDHEELWVVDLDTRNRVMRLVQLYKGSINSSQVRVAEVFRQAIIDNSPSILIAHNHPSGDPSPSPDDVAVTRAIVQTGKLMDIDVLDHLVIGLGHFVSLKERGLGF